MTGGPSGVIAALSTLRDVAGIAGSFVFQADGRLVAREIHAMFDDGALTEAAQRLARLRETFATVGDELDLAVIRFQDHKLYLKMLADGGASPGTLCILAEAQVNMPALRMAANLVARRIAGVVAQLEGAVSEGAPSHARITTEFAAEPGPVDSGAVASTRGMAPPGMRRFRGRVL